MQSQLLRVLLSCLILISASPVAIAQDAEKYASNTVFLELGGAGGLYSVNYDRSIWQISESFKLHGRVGFSFFSERNGLGGDYFVPITTHVIWGKIAHRAEVGGGITLASWTYRDENSETGFDRRTELIGHMSIGYRYQKLDGGIMFRVTYTPFLNVNSIVPYEHWAGVSVGYTFKRK